MRYSRIILIYILAAVAVVYARSAQLMYLTEPKSGFFTADDTVAAIALTVFMLVALGVCVVMSLMTRRAPSAAPRKSGILATSAILLAAGILYDTVFVSYITNAAAFVGLTRLFGVLAAAALMIYALRGAIPLLERVPVMIYIAIPLFFMFKLIAVFTVYATVSVIASNVVTIVFLCSALLYLLYLVKIENAVTPGRSAYVLFPVGMVASIAAMCCVVPQAAAYLSGRPELIHDDPHGLVLAAAFAFFCCVYTFSIYSRKNLIHHKRNTYPLAVDTTYHDMSSDFYSGVVAEDKESAQEQ